jgi:uncharacterized protein YdeI (YjbR/CyaY-like superfamily)
MAAAEDAPILTIHSRADLRDWLAAHHVPHETVVEELLCWGWIDSTPRTLDAERSRLMIAPRNPKSAWSAVNKAHVERARASGAMTPAGEAKVAAAVANGMWDFLNDVDALIDPPDLASALAATGTAEFWTAQPRTIRRGTLEWIKMAKTAETRAKRIKDVTDSAAKGLRPGPFRR